MRDLFVPLFIYFVSHLLKVGGLVNIYYVYTLCYNNTLVLIVVQTHPLEVFFSGHLAP